MAAPEAAPEGASRDRSRSPRGSGAPDSFIGLDFDCTITIRHYYKCIAEKLLGKQVFSHPHSAVFNAWLKRHRVNLEVPEVPDSDHWMVSGVERLTKQLGEKKFKEMIREVFLGGEERIQELTEWFTKKTNDGISFAIITAGVASTVSMALEAVPEWDRFFPTDLVLDLSGSRHQVLSVTGQKALMLRDLRPTATRLVLVDDSLSVGPRSKPGKHL
ncbi:unnamed protein product, partial [Durusdinium trenchii]